MKTTTILALMASLMLLIACGGDDEEPMTTECDVENITYTNTIAEIFNGSCATSGCHNDTSLANGFSLDDYDASVLAVGFGRLVGSIKHEDNFTPMPFPFGSAKLEDCEISKIEAWIAAGTPE